MLGRALVLLIAGVTLAGCAGMSPKDRAEAEAEIRETVLRHQFKRYDREGDPVTKYFVRFGETGDPPGDFLDRFEDHSPPVAPASQAVEARLQGVTDPETDQPAAMFTIDGVEWVDDQTVVVEGGYRGRRVSAAGNLYWLHPSNGGWRIVKTAGEGVR